MGDSGGNLKAIRGSSVFLQGARSQCPPSKVQWLPSHVKQKVTPLTRLGRAARTRSSASTPMGLPSVPTTGTVATGFLSPPRTGLVLPLSCHASHWLLPHLENLCPNFLLLLVVLWTSVNDHLLKVTFPDPPLLTNPH